MALGDRKPSGDFVERDGGGGFQFLRRHSAPPSCAESAMGKAAGMSRRSFRCRAVRALNGIGVVRARSRCPVHHGAFRELRRRRMTAQKLETTAPSRSTKSPTASRSQEPSDLVANIPGADKAKFDAAEGR